MLDILGLDATAERVYQELVTHGPRTLPALASRIGLPAEAVRDAVTLLARFALVSRPGAATATYAASPPATALGTLIDRRRHALHEAELTAAALDRAYRSTPGDGSGNGLVELVTGPQAVAGRFEFLRLGASSEFLAMSESRPDLVTAGGGPGAVRGGVDYRVVIEHGTLGLPDAAEALSAHLRRRRLCRAVEKVPADLAIADRAAALVPLSDGTHGDGGEPIAMFVRAPGLINLLTALFESLWERAVPVCLDGSGAVGPARAAAEPGGVDLRILSLLMAGTTDSAIANQLGLGLRTVQRRVAYMMRLAGVSTRLQLGWHACSRGWLAGSP